MTGDIQSWSKVVVDILKENLAYCSAGLRFYGAPTLGEADA